jgi:ligand-binding sensor domain-containing protein
MVIKLYHIKINLHLSYKILLGIHTLGAFFLFFTFLFSSLNIQGQKMPFNLSQYGLEEGLSQVTINDMVLDDSGFLWIATQEGVNRFDGNLFKHFKHSKKDSTGLSGNFITKLFKDSKGYIWIGTARNGLNIYDPLRKIIRKVIVPEIDLTNSTVNGIIEGPESKIWVAFEKEGVLKLDPQNYDGHLKLDSTIGYNGSEIIEIYKDQKGEVWAAYPDHIRTLNSKNEIIFPFHHKAMSFLRIDDQLFIGSENGLFVYDIKSQKMEKVILENSGEIETSYVSSIIEFDSNSLWIGTGNGLYLYNYQKNKVLKKIRKTDRDNNGLSNGTVQSLLRNDNDQIFVGTANGLNMLCFVPSFFKNISKDIKGKHFSTLLNDNVVFSIFKDQNNYWIGTSDGGLNLILEDSAYYFQEDLSQTYSITGGTIRGIAKDSINNRMWFASTRGISLIDLNTFDPENPKFISINHDSENSNSISSNFIRDITLDKNGVLWAATASKGIFSIRYDSYDKFQIEKHEHNPSDLRSLASNNTYKITIDKNNGIWVGTDNGLCYLPDTNKSDTIVSWRSYKKKKSNRSIGENVIYDILIDSQSKIWIGSRGGLSLLSEDGK